jgi:hydrogenase nickel incorporation protein HypA/HybF
LHELSIAQNIGEIIRQTPAANRKRKVVAVNLRIGDLSGVVPDSLDFCFTAITAGTPLEGARLNFERVPVRAVCSNCRTAFAVRDLVFRCPTCASGELELTSGRELLVSAIEIEEDDREADGGHHD